MAIIRQVDHSCMTKYNHQYYERRKIKLLTNNECNYFCHELIINEKVKCETMTVIELKVNCFVFSLQVADRNDR